MTNRRLLALAIAVAIFMAVAIITGGTTDQGPGDGGFGTATDAGASAADIAPTTMVATEELEADGAQDQVGMPRFSDLPPISLGELPVEALDTLALIERGGPYPYDRDDLTFQNREGLLPDRVRGHYREYTVITPGEDDRGARRIVAGADGERYYTADHYRSFSEILFDDDR